MSNHHHHRRRLKHVAIFVCALALFVAFRVAQAGDGTTLPGQALIEPTPVASETAHAVARTFSELDEAARSAADSTSPAYVEQMIWQLNQYRAQQDLLPLKVNPALMEAAQNYAERLALGNFFGHYDPDFSCNRPSDRAAAAGYTQWTVIGENLAAGYPTPESALDALKRSAGHNAAMLNPGFREIGIGYYYEQDDASNVRQSGACPYTALGGPYRYYWVQLFGARTSNGVPVLPVIINGEAVSTTQRTVDVHIHGLAGGIPWARQMRFREEGTAWSPYEPYAPHRTFLLSPGSGLKTLHVELVGDFAAQTASDSIYLQDTSAPADPSITPRVFIPLVRLE